VIGIEAPNLTSLDLSTYFAIVD